jgi:hypothetical protein
MDTAKQCRYCDPKESVEAWVIIDEAYGGPYKARVMKEYRWNGWAVPAFTFREALRVAVDTHLLGAKYDDRGDSVEFASYDASRNAFVMTGGGRSVDDAPLIIEATPCCGRYDIGAMNWTWVETEEPEVGDLLINTSAHLVEV